jgi:RNA polymerase sigma-70 factor (ECF subfamily)
VFSVNKSGEGQVECADPKDFRKLYDATFEILFKVSYKIVGEEEAAEDLVHDSFIKANEKAMIFPSMNDATFWLIRVVKNASLNYAKRKTRESSAYHKALYEGRQQMESGETELLKNEAKKIALDALNQLPANLKEVLVLKEYADMNYKEIGQQLGITEGNVKIRVFRAKAQLLKIIGEEDVYLS